ncbi:NAD(P)H-quinone oxidoreductase [Kordiimonas lacus]|uniref:Putative NAD(P)H quinone oxidoreductase, PIG3 family n=1 Tax=Kordiimonas lacus TaxID=637679 RepID=A0A1G7A129_9PROT|nr:NAD(P)H-quinone oxidoreductase [Kordiimonas lacus]SDE08217.1 putative NAD(P)H quinone oxidoreductase, PIG3 family [Kordiimonas lacus]
MKAIEITTPGGPEVLKPCERDNPAPGAGELLIRVMAAGVNRPDVVQRQGRYPAPPGASDIPGLEAAGEVVALGDGAEGFKIGDKVCALVPGGGYAELCTANAASVMHVPKGFSMVQAAAIPETYFTVWSNLFDRAGLTAGETLLVHGGSSGIGSTAIQLAKAFGARVITTVGNAEKAEFCKKLGADVVVNYREGDYVEAVKDFTEGTGVNVVLDMVGGDYIAKNIECLAVEGRHVSIAFLQGPQVTMNMLPVMLKRLVLTGSTLRARDNAFKGAIAANLQKHVWPLMEAGKVAPVIDSTFPLDQAADAHARMETSLHMGKIMLEVA